jgi:hypothetical protein
MAEPINDLYGFSHRVTVQQQAQRLQCDGASSRGESGWLCVAMQQAFPPGPKLKQLTRQGVPPALRTAVWMEVSGAARKQAAVSANYFSSMALAGEASPFLKDIDKARASCTHTHTAAAAGGASALVSPTRLRAPAGCAAHVCQPPVAGVTGRPGGAAARAVRLLSLQPTHRLRAWHEQHRRTAAGRAEPVCRTDTGRGGRQVLAVVECARPKPSSSTGATLWAEPGTRRLPSGCWPRWWRTSWPPTRSSRTSWAARCGGGRGGRPGHQQPQRPG